MYFQNTNVDALGHSSYRYLQHDDCDSVFHWCVNNTALVDGTESEVGRVFILCVFYAKFAHHRIVSMKMVQRSWKLFCRWKLLELDMLPPGEGGALLIMSYMERLRPEEVPFRCTENGSSTGGERLLYQLTLLDTLLTPGGTPSNGLYERRGSARK